MVTQEDVDRLNDIRSTIMDLLTEANNLVRQHGSKHELERAKAYWIGHIDSALGAGNYMDLPCNLLTTIESIESTLPSENDEEECEE